jgi:TPR repeat protein
MIRPVTPLPCLLIAALLFCAAPASAQIKHLSDPVYEKMAPEDPHPMEDLLLLGKEGDTRAQFILGDLYGKGKGGLPRSVKKSREWFEKSARGGYAQSFIRLAALEKRVKKPEDAYKWYTLAIETLPAAERRWPQRARDELVKEHGLTTAQIRAARQAAQEWKKPAAPDKKDAQKKTDKKTAAPVDSDTDTAARIPPSENPETIEPAAGDALSADDGEKPDDQN